MGILKIDDVPPPFGADGREPGAAPASDRPGAAAAPAADAARAGTPAVAAPSTGGAGRAGSAAAEAGGRPAPSAADPAIPPHVVGAAPPPAAPAPPQATSSDPFPPGSESGSGLFDTSALTAPPPPDDAGPDSAGAASDPTPIEPDPVRTLEFKPKIVEQLSTVFDPEIPVNIYELGLIYDILVDAAGLAVIRMTLTAPGCPAAVTLPAEVQGKVAAIDGVREARVDLVWEPPWDKDRMSDAAKLQLGIFD